ncbi:MULTISPECIES: aldo/keto reductase [Pseudomonas]|jgi:2,5-diketo-D-gluconate reductase A|uniref:aldo/keto reductase n=1 Tax=Pseudomonas TaxID=286 RepID=UPI0009537AC0|nr:MULTISPECIES: aldo/keto reductase [Pseudomonas]WLG65416.1 aldo/keto reductase [Pseudomonas brassicacearum]SIS02460.1 2,5-diketo-D-gluconate reductase A [Pseudomonas sp. A214]
MDNHQPVIELLDGNRIPQLGLGVWQASPEEARAAVSVALKTGYRHVDTASIYKNEDGVGAGLQDSGIPRQDVFITTKVWNEDQGYERTLRAIDESLGRLELDYVDLLLIHWPAPSNGLFIETWQAMIEAQKAGKARSIGVSNFTAQHLDQLVNATGVKPVLNQVELHPFFQQAELRKAHENLGVKTESWSPLGQGEALAKPEIQAIAQKHQRTPAQVIIKWHLSQGLIAIPKSVTPSRISENFKVFDFELDNEDFHAIERLNEERRLGPDPDRFS